MLFRSETASKTWDTWTYYSEGTYYLYYLISEQAPGDGFGVATSQDGVKWKDHGWVIHASDKMVRYFGGGSIWKGPSFEETGRFLCNCSEWRLDGDKNVQNILFAWSQDLIHWNKFDDGLMFKIDERFYKKIERDAHGPWEDPRWDGICVVPRPGGGYYGYWTATPRNFLGFGFGESDDGFHWRALEPPRIEWGDTPKMYFIEVGGVHQLGDKYYAMLADYATVNCGMFSFVSDTPSGPFRPSAKNFGLLRNQSKMHADFTRFLDSPGGVLVNHHTLAEGQFSDEHFVVYCAPLKKAAVIDGALYFVWWNGNEKLKSRKVRLNTSDEQQINFETDKGIVLEGTMQLPGHLLIHNGGGGGTGILVNEQSVTEMGTMNVDGTDFQCKERVDREITFGPTPRFRLLLNRNMLEFYLNDFFIQCYTMEQMPDGIMFYRNASDLKLWHW